MFWPDIVAARANPDDTVDRLLRLGASSGMICRRYGLSHQEVALRRDLIGLPRRKGRYPTLSEEQEAESWRAWCAALECGLVPGDEAALPAWAVELTESGGGSLAVIWATGE